jgi:hypothetical protein
LKEKKLAKNPAEILPKKDANVIKKAIKPIY